MYFFPFRKLFNNRDYAELHSQSRLCEAFLNNMPACYLLMVVTSPYKSYQMFLRMQAFDVHIDMIYTALNSYTQLFRL